MVHLRQLMLTCFTWESESVRGTGHTEGPLTCIVMNIHEHYTGDNVLEIVLDRDDAVKDQ